MSQVNVQSAENNEDISIEVKEMTIEEKRQMIEKYCDSRKGCIGDVIECPLYNCNGCYTDLSDEIIERNFKLVRAMPDYRGMREYENYPAQKSNHWTSVEKEGLPKESGDYLVVTNGTRIREVLRFSTRHQAFNASDSLSEAPHAIECTHWMPLPEYPKE